MNWFLVQGYVDIIRDLPDSSTGTYTLTVEVTGRVLTIPRIDAPYINPPDVAISETAQFIYDIGTFVNLYIIDSTPPPVPLEGEPPIDYQVASFKGYGST